MIIINPLEWDVEQFLTELDLEIRFMQIHNPSDKLEIVLNEKTVIPKCLLNVYDIPIRYDKSMIKGTIDVMIKE